MTERDIHAVEREQVLRELGFSLIQARDGRYVATEVQVSRVPNTAPHETPEDAWLATYKRVIRAN